MRWTGPEVYDRRMTASQEARAAATPQQSGPAPSSPPKEEESATGPEPSATNPVQEPGLTPALQRELMLVLQDFSTESSRYADTVRRAHGLGHSDVHALAEVMTGHRTDSPLRAGDIARRLVISASAVTAVIDRLVTRGHLERASDPTDRREVVLHPTPSAARTGKAMFAAMERELAAEFAQWTSEEMDVLRRRVPQLTDAIRRAQAAATDSRPQ